MDHSRRNKQRRIIAGLLFVVYFSCLSYRLFFFAYGPYFRLHENTISYNLIPFKTIASYLIGSKTYQLEVRFINLLGNILAFMPMGFLLPVIFGQLRSFPRIITMTVLISLVIEMMQLLLRLGIADIDDVILNTLGGILGFILLKLSLEMLGQRQKGQ